MMNEENQENSGKKSDGDVSESVRVLIRATMTEELAKFKAGSVLGTEQPIPTRLSRSQGEQCSQISGLTSMR